MRLLLFFCTLIFTSCTAQPTGSARQSSIDTLKMFDPKPEKIDENLKPSDIYKNCIAVKQGFFVIVIDQIQNRFETESELAGYVKSHSTEIKSKLYILYDSSTNFKQIVTILDVLKTNKVNNYRVIDMDAFFKVPPPAIVRPAAVSHKVDKNDPAYFIITILEKSIRVKHLNAVNTFADASGLDKFITTHKAEIDSTKILIVSAATTPYTSFKPVKEVLKKHRYFVFQIVTEQQDE